MEEAEYTGTKDQWANLVEDVPELNKLTPKFRALVTFDPQGGKFTETSKKVDTDSTYGELPVPTRRDP